MKLDESALNNCQNLMCNQKNLQKVPDSTLKCEVCSELFFQSRFLGSSKQLHSSPFLKMESSGFDDNENLENYGEEFELLVLARRDEEARDYYCRLPAEVKNYIKSSRYGRWLKALSISRV